VTGSAVTPEYSTSVIAFFSINMPPKRPPKRGSDEDNDKKRNKRHAKNKRGGEPTFDNYDEAMDGSFLPCANLHCGLTP
jgi:hypothetical protein